ncbi:asparagine-rich protein-like [Myxocyprinus asiaticus]|uniref:asparagine-rich protein-like n=1 Tax=Myxocyprinus asiaticus TaxID=70543 RepID=UPI002221FDB4|nr:asparagine-rich protein-like [Myxocyprinus asiaticus]
MESKWLCVAVLAMACMMHGVVGQNSTNDNNSTVSNSSTSFSNMTGNLTQMGPHNMTGNLTQMGPLNMTGNLTQMGPLNMTGNLTQMGPLNMTGNLTQMGPLNMTGNLTQMGPLNMTGNLTQMGPHNMTGNLTQMGPLNMTGNLTQMGPLNMTGNLTQMGPLNNTSNSTQTGSPNMTQIGPNNVANNNNNMSLATVNKANCKKDRACFSSPVSCDPSISGSCFFVSTRAVSGNANNLTFELSGDSSGYIAVSLSRDNKEGDGDTVYSCANNNGTAKFIRATLNNSILTQDNTFISGNFSGSVNNTKIQCIFVAPGLSSVTRAANTGTFVFFFTGSITNGTLGSPVTRLSTNASVDLTNSNSTDVGIITTTTNGTASSNTTTTAKPTGGSNAGCHAASQAALVILSGIITVLLL